MQRVFGQLLFDFALYFGSLGALKQAGRPRFSFPGDHFAMNGTEEKFPSVDILKQVTMSGLPNAAAIEASGIESAGRDLQVLVVIPAYNEQGKVGAVVRKTRAQGMDPVLVVDDCSSDQTAAEAQAAGALVIRHERNLGVGAAIRTGIDYALAHDFAVVAVLSGDDQHDPTELPGLLWPILSAGYDFVQGSRRFRGLQAPNIGWFRRFFTWVYAVTFRLLTGFPCSDATNGGRAFRTRIFADGKIDLWQSWLNSYELEPYLFYKVVHEGYKVTEAPMKVIYHTSGTTKMKPVRDWWRIFRPMLYLALGLKK
ncbi:MAG TPA: glycosyltransferase family 2 protein [Anaerolineae bacterium]|nr:glycosyltransferase family 2 protein [Anaerolineae bacterium]